MNSDTAFTDLEPEPELDPPGLFRISELEELVLEFDDAPFTPGMDESPSF